VEQHSNQHNCGYFLLLLLLTLLTRVMHYLPIGRAAPHSAAPLPLAPAPPPADSMLVYLAGWVWQAGGLCCCNMRAPHSAPPRTTRTGTATLLPPPPTHTAPTHGRVHTTWVPTLARGACYDAEQWFAATAMQRAPDWWTANAGAHHGAFSIETHTTHPTPLWRHGVGWMLGVISSLRWHSTTTLYCL